MSARKHHQTFGLAMDEYWLEDGFVSRLLVPLDQLYFWFQVPTLTVQTTSLPYLAITRRDSWRDAVAGDRASKLYPLALYPRSSLGAPPPGQAGIRRPSLCRLRHSLRSFIRSPSSNPLTLLNNTISMSWYAPPSPSAGNLPDRIPSI
jgi:hypothetical protein